MGKPIIFRVQSCFFKVFGILKLPTHFLKLILRLCRMSFGAYASDLRHLRVGWEGPPFFGGSGVWQDWMDDQGESESDFEIKVERTPEV